MNAEKTNSEKLAEIVERDKLMKERFHDKKGFDFSEDAFLQLLHDRSELIFQVKSESARAERWKSIALKIQEEFTALLKNLPEVKSITDIKSQEEWVKEIDEGRTP